MKEDEMKKKQKRDETNGYVQVYQILDARHIHDEGLLVNRTGNFMLVHSFLLVVFATLAVNEMWYRSILAIAGVVICVIFYPLLWMQLKTARLWLEIEDEMEKEMVQDEVFPVIEKEENGKTKAITTAPNQRHAQMTKQSCWMWPTWLAGPTALVTVMLGVWTALLIIAC